MYRYEKRFICRTTRVKIKLKIDNPCGAPSMLRKRGRNGTETKNKQHWRGATNTNHESEYDSNFFSLILTRLDRNALGLKRVSAEDVVSLSRLARLNGLS